MAQWKEICNLRNSDDDEWNYSKMYFTSDNIGYIMGDYYYYRGINYYTIKKTEDGGKTFTSVFVNSMDEYSYSINSFYFKDKACYVYSSGLFGSALFKTTNDFNSWELIEDESEDLFFGIINIINDSTGFYDKYEYYSDDHKMVKFINFEKDTIITFDGLKIYNRYFLNENIGFLCYYYDTLPDIKYIAKTINGGMNWTNVFSDSVQIVKSFSFISDSIGYALLYSNSLLKTTNAGNSWDFLGLITKKNINDLKFLNENLAYALVNSESVLKTTDGALTWTTENIGFAKKYYSMACPSDSVVYLLTTDNRIISIHQTITKNPENIKIYPNPTQSEIYVNNVNVKEIKLFDNTGKIVKTVSKSNTIDLSNFATGIYFLQIITDKESFVKKIIKN